MRVLVRSKASPSYRHCFAFPPRKDDAMRLTIAALPLFALLAPLHAAAADHGTGRAVAALNDPAMQDRMADTVVALVGALMQIQVSPLAEAVARAHPHPEPSPHPPAAPAGHLTGRSAERRGGQEGDNT